LTEDRTCLKCGAVYGDALAHRRWHLAEEERWDTVLALLRGLAEAVDRLTDINRLEEPCL
jgi:aminoglycoside phosphotransferase